MKLELKKIGVLPRDQDLDYPVEEVQTLFERHGIDVCFIEGDEHPTDLDLVVALGGDGTVLRAFDRFPQCPVLAINFGTVGFLTAGDRKDLAQIVQLLVDGEYFVSERLVLSCRFPGGESLVYNEVTLRARHKLIFTDVFVDDAKIRTIRGDGVVVGTPTGSTGLLMAMGAPLVMPEVRCMMLDGINEYNFTSRPLILPAEKRVRLRVNSETRDEHVALIIDGREIRMLTPEDEVHVGLAEHMARLIYLDDNYFFNNLSEKLSW
jgi:NAD+ kinase